MFYFLNHSIGTHNSVHTTLTQTQYSPGHSLLKNTTVCWLELEGCATSRVAERDEGGWGCSDKCGSVPGHTPF